MHHAVLVAALVVAVVEWVAVGERWRKVEYFAKPGVMILIIAWLILGSSLGQKNLLWFTIGAFFSLMGDIFLLLRWERPGFALGLASFLLAHLSYIVAFNSPLPSFGLYSLVLGVAILALVLRVGWRVLDGLRSKGLRRLTIPVTIYILTISIMVFSAMSASFNLDWDFVPALLVGLGATSFAASDTFLAWNKFVSPFRYARVLLMITYHFGQVAILIGAVAQYG
ncbi:MAG: lysoplasmalogenase [Anaerolineales bacterium]|nr:lysoplasmalogenase [Anaerolineales bacterium]